MRGEGGGLGPSGGTEVVQVRARLSAGGVSLPGETPDERGSVLRLAGLQGRIKYHPHRGSSKHGTGAGGSGVEVYHNIRQRLLVGQCVH